MWERQGRAVVDIKPLVCPVWDVGEEVDVEKMGIFWPP